MIAAMAGVIVLVAGHTGSGKTMLTNRLGKEMRWVPLDNDEITESLASIALVALGQPADDRSSDIYQEKVLPAKYDTLWRTATHIAESGQVAVIAAPFIAQLTDPEQVAHIEDECAKRSIRLAGVWLTRGGPMPEGFPRWMHPLDNTRDRASYNVVMDARELLAPEIGWQARP